MSVLEIDWFILNRFNKGIESRKIQGFYSNTNERVKTTLMSPFCIWYHFIKRISWF